MPLYLQHEERVRRELMERLGFDYQTDRWIWGKANQIVEDFIYQENPPEPFMAFLATFAALSMIAAHADLRPSKWSEFLAENQASFYGLGNWELDRIMREQQAEAQNQEPH